MNYTQEMRSDGNDSYFGVNTLLSAKISDSQSHTAAILTCGWRVHNQAWMGSWYKPRQQDFHRSLSKSIVLTRYIGRSLCALKGAKTPSVLSSYPLVRMMQPAEDRI